MRSNAQAADGTVALAEIAETSRLVGSGFSVEGLNRQTRDAALEGSFLMVGLRPGIIVHTSDATDLNDMTTRVEQRPGLTIHLFLEGQADASLGGSSLGLGRKPGAAVEGVITARAEPDLFERRSHSGDHIRKVNVTVSTEWLAESAFQSTDDFRQVHTFARSHRARFAWLADASLVSVAEQMLHPPAYSALMRNLYLESRALDLVASGFAALTGQKASDARGRLKPYDRHRLRLIEDYISEHPALPSTLDEIARAGGVSVSTLRRLFKAAHGTSVFDYLRCRGLERARHALEREGVAVSEAAFLAGYASAANFATAFKRRFGLTPTEVRRH